MVFNITFNQSITTPIMTDPKTIIINIKPLAILVLAVAIYSILVFKFYKYLAKRDILMANWNHKYSWNEGTTEKFFKILLFTLEYIILVPLLIFFWFLVMAGILLFMSNNTAPQIMLLSMAIIAGVRIVSYYSEDMARDVAKLMPLTLLAIFASNLSFFSLDVVLENAKHMFTMTDKLFFYLLFAVLIEFIMRAIQLIINSVKKHRGVKETEKKKKEKNKTIEIN